MKTTIAEDRLRLPSFDCPNPNCTAKNIAFAVSREAKNESELIPLEYISENTPADFAVVCPKCKSKKQREKAIFIWAPDKSSGKRRQSISICYDFVGFIPLDELMKQETA